MYSCGLDDYRKKKFAEHAVDTYVGLGMLKLEEEKPGPIIIHGYCFKFEEVEAELERRGYKLTKL